MEQYEAKQAILDGKVTLGIELGSTRIKSVLIGEDHSPIASGSHSWENRFEDGIWTYRLEDVWTGIQDSYGQLCAQAEQLYGVPVTRLSALGFSAMMHGYLVFDEAGRQLVPFRTWRNTMTEPAAKELTALFGFNIPQRWSIAHLRQAMLNGEPHLGEIAFLTTLAGYVHWQLTGQRVLGVGEASGVFPIDSALGDYDPAMLRQFDLLAAADGCPWTLEEILPKVLPAGAVAGHLTPAGARLLDPTGRLQAGAPLCPPEGDAGAGMVATNSVAERTGNVSAGTSIFTMVVLEKPLSRVYPEIDMVTTPTGKPVAMVHCNNCTSDLDGWISLFREVTGAVGAQAPLSTLYDAFYHKALEGDPDCGGLLSYNYYSGEPITGLDEGRPLFVRTPDSCFTLANFARTLLFSALGTLKLGMDILFEQEKVRLDRLLGHGGLFKTPGVGQRLMAAAVNAPVLVMETAGEGGPWGMALLASYMARHSAGESLEDYLQNRVFAHQLGEQALPDPQDVQGFRDYMDRYRKGLAIERTAVESL